MSESVCPSTFTHQLLIKRNPLSVRIVHGTLYQAVTRSTLPSDTDGVQQMLSVQCVSISHFSRYNQFLMTGDIVLIYNVCHCTYAQIHICNLFITNSMTMSPLFHHNTLSTIFIILSKIISSVSTVIPRFNGHWFKGQNFPALYKY